MASSLRYTDRSTDTKLIPNRLNELWRAGRPHIYATALAERLDKEQSQGTLSCDAPQHCQQRLTDADKDLFAKMLSNGSRGLIHKQLQHFGQGIKLQVEADKQEPIHIRYESEGLFAPVTLIHLMQGAKAHIIEEHHSLGSALIFCLRHITLEEGAELTLELREYGSGESRCFNITDALVKQARLTHYTEHHNHAWAREETGARLELCDKEKGESEIKLLSANLITGKQVLDQRTSQDHMHGNTRSKLLYKNVIDGHAHAIFDGNIMVAEGALHTDAHMNNFNLMLSKDATIDSLPQLEILADKVACSHGSASGPMNPEELFYLCARGIPAYEAQLLVAQGFLEDVRRQLGLAPDVDSH